MTTNSDVMMEARALLAVGMDGSVVILQVNADNEYLAHDARLSAPNLSEVMKFQPETSPREPGLYEFKGFSSAEPAGTTGHRIVHRGSCAKVAC